MPPSFKAVPGISQGQKNILIQTFVTEFPIKALYMPIIHWFTIGLAPIWSEDSSSRGGGAGTMVGTSAKASPMVEIVNITPHRRWYVAEKIRMIEASMAEG